MVKRASALPQKDSTQSEVSTISEDSNNIPTRITFPPCPPLLHMPSPPSHSFPHARISPFLSPRADLSNTLGHFPRRDTDFPRRHDNSWPRASLSPGTPCPPPLPSATTVTAGSNPGCGQLHSRQLRSSRGAQGSVGHAVGEGQTIRILTAF